MNSQRSNVKRSTIAIGLAAMALIVTALLVGQSRVEAGQLNANSAGVRSYLYRFDPAAQTFFTIPLSTGAMPSGVAVTGTNPTHVWIAESGLDRITHVVFTDTSNYIQTSYPITSTAQSKPYRIAVAGNDVWFTERGANRVGRLNAVTGQLDEFYGQGLSPNAGLSDIKVAPDGTVWIGGQTAQRLIKLTVTSPSVFAFTEYTDTVRPGFVVAPSFLAVGSDNLVGMTMPEAPSYRMAVYEPGAQSFIWPSLPPTGATPTPYGIALTPGLIWYADPGRDRLGQIEIGTYPILNEFGPITDAVELTAESAQVLWLTQQSGQAAAIGRFVYTNTTSTRFDSFALPVPNLRLTGIAAIAGGGVWSVGNLTYQSFLPVVLNNHPVGSAFGVQFYGGLNASTGFTYAAESKAGWVRFQVLWSTIESTNTSPENYHWTNLDVSAQNVQAAGINAIFTIEGNPAWAAATPGGPVYNNADFQEFVGAVVARYPFISHWEIYNEPDRIERFGNQGKTYAELLDSIYPVIKAANPAAQVVMGGLALDWFIEQGGPFNRNFLRDVLMNCSGTCFDIANFHYYPAFRSQWEAYGRDIIGKANFVRQILNTFHFSRPIFATEMGWPAGTSWGSPDLSARYVPKGYIRGLAAGLPATVWFSMLDADYSSPGLLDSSTVPGSFIPRPAYTAFKALTTLAAGAKYVGTIPVSSPLEGYQFLIRGKRLDVYWYDCPSMSSALGLPQDCANTAPLAIVAARIAKYDLYGNKLIVNDVDDGVLDGRITFSVGTSPIYVSYSP